MPIGNGRVYWFATKNMPQRGSQAAGVDAKQQALQHLTRWPKLVQDVVDATESSSVLNDDINDRPPMTTWGKDRITLLGDAAHATTPHMGQGACQAIEDAVVLARCLARDSNVTKAIQAYESQRIPRTTNVINTSRKIGRMLQLENPILCWFRDIGMKLMSGVSLARILVYAGYEVPDLSKPD